MLACLIATAVLAAGYAAARLTDLEPIAVAFTMEVATAAYLSRPLPGGGRLSRSLLLTAALLGIGTFGLQAIRALHDPGVWDFLCFFLDGKVVMSGLDLYSVDSYRQVWASLSVPVRADDEFMRGVLDVGFKYPPPTILLVAPFGLMDFRTGLAVWMALVVVLPALVCAVLLRAELTRGASRSEDGLFAIALITLSPGGEQTVVHQQTLFACLAALLLIRRLNRHWLAGAVGSIGIVFKTLLIIAPLYLLISGRYLAFLASTITMAALLAAVWLVAGVNPMIGYLAADWVGKVPWFEFSQEVNQSMLGVTIRTAGEDSATHPLKRIEYLIGAAVISVITAAAALWARLQGRQAVILGLAVASSLLVYPGTLASYGLLLLVPLVTMIRAGAHHPAMPRWLLAAATGLFFGLETVSMFAATALLWVLLIAVAFMPRAAAMPHPDRAARPRPGAAPLRA